MISEIMMIVNNVVNTIIVILRIILRHKSMYLSERETLSNSKNGLYMCFSAEKYVTMQEYTGDNENAVKDLIDFPVSVL